MGVRRLFVGHFLLQNVDVKLGPSSFLEVRKMLPLLTAGHPGFHIVALSIPGFGFSQAPSKKGFRVNQYAEVCDCYNVLGEDAAKLCKQVAHKVMMALGYNEYGECMYAGLRLAVLIDEKSVTQGGDLGTMVSQLHVFKIVSRRPRRSLARWLLSMAASMSRRGTLLCPSKCHSHIHTGIHPYLLHHVADSHRPLPGPSRFFNTYSRHTPLQKRPGRKRLSGSKSRGAGTFCNRQRDLRLLVRIHFHAVQEEI